MERTNTFINNVLTLTVTLILCLNLNAQRLGIKPMLGLSDNGTRHNQKASPSFAESSFSGPKPFFGLLLSYTFFPSWEIEFAWQRRPLSVSADVLNPQNQKVLGNILASQKLVYYQLNLTKHIKDLSSNCSLKAIVGVELINKVRGYGGDFKTAAVDTLVLPGYFPVLLSPNQFNKQGDWTTGFMAGTGVVWKVKQKNVAELRLCMAYQMQSLHGLSINTRVNGTQQREEFKATQLNYNLTLLLNLSTLLGSKWRD